MCIPVKINTYIEYTLNFYNKNTCHTVKHWSIINWHNLLSYMSFWTNSTVYNLYIVINNFISFIMFKYFHSNIFKLLVRPVFFSQRLTLYYQKDCFLLASYQNQFLAFTSNDYFILYTCFFKSFTFFTRWTFPSFQGQILLTHFTKHLTEVEGDIYFINVWYWCQQMWAEPCLINNSENKKNLRSLAVNGKENSYIFMNPKCRHH